MIQSKKTDKKKRRRYCVAFYMYHLYVGTSDNSILHGTIEPCYWLRGEHCLWERNSASYG